VRPATLRTAATALTLALALAACSGKDAPADDDRIVLTPVADGAGQAAGNPVGDGTRAAVKGYRLEAVRLPGADGPGPLSFRITDRSGTPVTRYEKEQTKLLHLYVVRDDLAAFRHVHPELGDDGTWRGRVDLGTPGRWRVVTEFVPKGSDRPIVLGATVRVPGAWSPTRVPRGDDAMSADDGVVSVRVLDTGSVGPNGRLRLGISSVGGEPVQLGSYLGATAHLTGFAVGTHGFAHVHPLGAPDVTDDETVLTFHTTFAAAGDYRMFVQVRVDGLLHQVAVTVPVAD